MNRIITAATLALALCAPAFADDSLDRAFRQALEADAARTANPLNFNIDRAANLQPGMSCTDLFYAVGEAAQYTFGVVFRPPMTTLKRAERQQLAYDVSVVRSVMDSRRLLSDSNSPADAADCPEDAKTMIDALKAAAHDAQPLLLAAPQ
jgi:hypothetical protein